MLLTVKKEKCNNCFQCLSVCSFGGIELENDEITFNSNCNGCKACLRACNNDAIKMEELVEEKNLSKYKDIWVLVEEKQGKIDEITYELLGKGRELADESGERLCAVLISNKNNLEELKNYKIDVIYTVINKSINIFNENIISHILVNLINEFNPNIFIVGATFMGRAVAAKVAAKVNTGLTADCIKLKMHDNDKKLLIQTRPAFGGNIMADIVCKNKRPQMVTVRKNVINLSISKADKSECNIIKCDYLEKDINGIFKILKRIIEKDEYNSNLQCAEIVVAGGRGIRSKEGFKTLEKLAKILNGSIAVTKPIVDLGWYDYEDMVGQTGKTVNPKIYFAFGISGAIQHTAGINADILIAINKDENAAIFKKASYGIIGDAEEVSNLIFQEILSLHKKENMVQL